MESRGKYSIYHPDTREKVQLNESASDIISCIDQGLDHAGILSFIKKSYTDSPIKIASRLDAFLQQLIDRQIIDPSLSIQVPTKHVLTKPPLRRIFLELTTQCNLRCPHCYMDGGKKTERELSTAEIFDLIDQAHNLGVYEFYISGGEPFLHPHLFKILNYLSSRHMVIALYTNGTLLGKAEAQALAGIPFLELYISLDGATAESHDAFRGVKGCFESTLKGIEYAKEANIPVRANIMVTEHNKDEVSDIIELLKNRGVDWFALDKFTRSGRAQDWDSIRETEIEDALIRAYARHGFQPCDSSYPSCGIGNFMCFVSADGFVGLCTLLNHRIAPDFMGGNVRTIRLQEIWESSAAFVQYRNLRCQVKDCPHYKNCSGGCPARALLHYGNIWGPDRFECRLHESTQSSHH